MNIRSVTLDRRGLNEILARPFSVKLIALCVFLSLIAIRPAIQGAPLQEARVSHVIQDVRLLQSNAAPRPAAVNDQVRQGTAVRTAAQSRAELTFSDLTITRIGENTVFSFKGDSREVQLDSGAILLQVPQGAEAAKIRTAAVTASITGGTGLINANTGFPSKLYMMEGIGELCNNSGECVTAHGGEMVMGNNGQLSKPQKFNAKLLFKTSPLLTDFPPLANEPLFFEVFDQGGEGDENQKPVEKDPIDIISQVKGATGATGGTGSTGGKFGPPSTISSPDPYLITSGTQINTDPTITTNGVTDQGKIYRGDALDGPPTQYLFGEAPTAFDQFLFDGGPTDHVPIAGFKFAHLQLTGDPTVTIPAGSAINLALVSVGDITSGGPGGTLTFAGIDRLTILTQAGSITLGPEISFAFASLSHLELYARGTGSNLTMGSAISNIDVVKFYAEGSVQVNGDVSTNNFTSIAGEDYLFGSGTINTTNIDVQALGNANIDASKFPDFTGDANFVAGDTLTINLSGVGGTLSANSLTGQGTTINLNADTPHTFDLGDATVSFVAGTGGIQAPNIDFLGGTSLTLTSGADINVHSVGEGFNDPTISAATSFTASGEVFADTLSAGTTVDVGGALVVDDTLTAGGNINVGNFLLALNINAPSGILTVQGGIVPFFDDNVGAALQHTFNVDSIESQMGIDFNGNQFGGINGLSSGGRLTINANTIIFNTTALASPSQALGISFANFNGADSGAFGGGEPSNGGDGGIFIVNTTGDITADNAADITATTGINSDAGVYSGAGGSVTLHSSGGTVTVDNRIEVSSDDGQNQRQSASGGTILLQSDLTTGPGITVGANAQLLSLLNTKAPGPGGSITLSTMGADITVSPGAVIQADGGTITMDQSDPPGSSPGITIDGATLTCATLNISSPGDISIGANTPVTINAGAISLLVSNPVTGNLGSGGSIVLNQAGNLDVATGNLSLTVDTSNGGHADSDVMVSVSANNISVGGSLNTFIVNQQGSISGNVAINFVAPAGIDAAGRGAFFAIVNEDDGGTTPGGTIGGDALVHVTADHISTEAVVANDFNLFGTIHNSGGSVVGNCTVMFDISGAITTEGRASFDILNFDTGGPNGGGTIGGDATVNINASALNINASASMDGELLVKILSSGGAIGGNALLNAEVSGAIMTQGKADFQISNSGPNAAEAGTIGIDATIKVTAASISAGKGLFADIDNTNGNITGTALIDFGITGDIDIQIGSGIILYNSVGTIGSDATMKLTAVNITATGMGFSLFNVADGMIGGVAKIDFTASGDVSGANLFHIYNNDAGSGAGSIGSDAIVNVSANNISADSFETAISNEGGHIGGKADVEFNFSGDIDAKNGGALVVVNNSVGSGVIGGVIDGDAMIAVSGDDVTIAETLNIEIFNFSGSIGGNAAITLTAANISADSLYVSIDNRNGGTITGNATIDMNVSGDTTVTNDATVQILGDDPTGSAAINFNGGNYGVGGTFLSTIEGNGAITFTNANVHADIVKAGVFGTNGTLMIGGGSLSADTVLKLYAPGSNGTLHFTNSVSLSSGTAMVLAANTITIDPTFTVTINGDGGAANIYTNHPDYSGPGGTTPGNGSFGGNGATLPQSLPPPPFGAPVISSASVSNLASPLAAKSGTPLDGAINVSSSGELLSMLNTAVIGPGGKVRVAASNRARNSATPRRFNAEDGSEADRGARKPIHGGANNTQPPSNLPPLGPPGT